MCKIRLALRQLCLPVVTAKLPPRREVLCSITQTRATGTLLPICLQVPGWLPVRYTSISYRYLAHIDSRLGFVALALSFWLERFQHGGAAIEA